jgi:hypothetical protein
MQILEPDSCVLNARPELVGKTFGEILYLFDNAVPCGMRKSRPNSQGGYTLINPPPETVFEARSDVPHSIPSRIIICLCLISEQASNTNLYITKAVFLFLFLLQERDRLLVISEDEDSYQPGVSHAPQHTPHVPGVEKHVKQVLKVLICGWRNDLHDVLRLIDNNVARGNNSLLTK